MPTVSDILSSKGGEVYTIEHECTVFDAIKKMVKNNIGSLLITKEEALCGILTERDYLRRIVLEGRTSKTTQVREVMTTNLICVDPTHSIDHCMAIITKGRIRHLPVMKGEQLVGLVSIGDLVKHLASEQEAQIRYLSDYISGRYPA